MLKTRDGQTSWSGHLGSLGRYLTWAESEAGSKYSHRHYCFIITIVSDSIDPAGKKTCGTQVVDDTGMATWTVTTLPLGASNDSLLLTVLPLLGSVTVMLILPRPPPGLNLLVSKPLFNMTFEQSWVICALPMSR